MWNGGWELWGLWVSAFISSTLFPGGSEVVLAALLLQKLYDPWLLLLIVTTGNTLGGATSWWLGWLIARRYPARLLTKPQHARAVVSVQRYGSVILLFSWVPLIGDPLCVAAGWLRLSFIPCLLFIALGKAARYGVIVYAL